jgi:hypothetical protein
LGVTAKVESTEIQRRHFNAMAAQCGMGETAESLIAESSPRHRL